MSNLSQNALGKKTRDKMQSYEIFFDSGAGKLSKVSCLVCTKSSEGATWINLWSLYPPIAFYNQYPNSSRVLCNAWCDMPLNVETLWTCRVLIAGNVHSHKVMRSSWVKWCWKWIISSLSPNGTVGTFLLNLALRGHPSFTTTEGSGFTHQSHNAPSSNLTDDSTWQGARA